MTTNHRLKRELKHRHLTMMALGGTIGTGLLVASGAAIYDGGPGSAVLGYILVAFVVFFLMASLGEMSAHSPTTGSFCEYSAKYVDKSFGFAMSWNYWFNWVMVVASEVIAAGFMMQFWFPSINVWLWTVSFFILILFINLVAVKIYGEIEYYLAFVKVSAVIIFIIVGLLAILGLFSSDNFIGFKNITTGDAPFHGGLLGFFSVFLIAGYSFQGTELIGISAGEAENPSVSIPEAIKSVFWRIIIFYILSIIVVSFLVPYNDPVLANPHSNILMSPFTIVFDKVGLKYAASIMNVVVITAIISAANSSMYTASRILWHIGKSEKGFNYFQRINKRGVPVVGVLVTAGICVLLIFASFFDSGLIFRWLVNVISLAGYIAWFGICLSHYRFRRAYTLQGGNLNKLPYRARWFPIAPICAMTTIIIITIGQEMFSILKGRASLEEFIATYSGIFLFLLVMLAYKITKKTKLIPLENIPLKNLANGE
jgi:lysine-specific permease